MSNKEGWDIACLCRHFYSPTYNREILSRADHTNLLATPKGYRWYGPEGEDQLRRRAMQRAKATKKKEPPPPFPGMYAFLAEIWSIMTPQMINSLMEILMEEFEMSRDDALQFLMRQKARSDRLAEMEVMGPCRLTDQDICWARTTARMIASKVTQYVEMMTSARKTPRTMILYRHLLQGLQRAFNVGPGNDSPLKKTLTRVAEGLAVWLSSIPGENNQNIICTDLISLYSPTTVCIEHPAVNSC